MSKNSKLRAATFFHNYPSRLHGNIDAIFKNIVQNQFTQMQKKNRWVFLNRATP
jgi:fibrillarin-like rRNA methylase